MVSKRRMDRKKRQAKHIPSPMAWSREQNKWIPNPEIEANNPKIKKDGI